jgi:hypothetical protein
MHSSPRVARAAWKEPAILTPRHSRRAALAVLLAACCLGLSSLAFANAALPSPARIVYTSPRPNARFVRPQAGLIFRFDRPLARAEQSVTLTVTGSRSGTHAGQARFTADGRTLLFQPAEAFAWGEHIHVALAGAPAFEAAAAAPRATLEFTTGAGHAPAPPFGDGSDLDPLRPLATASPAQPARPFATETGLPVLTPILYGTPAPGLMFLGLYTWSGLSTPYMYILDNAGTPVFHRQGATTDFKLQPNGLITYFDLAAVQFYVIDSTYTVVDSFRCTNGYETDAHELLLLPNGNALVLGIDRQIVDMTEIVPGGYAETTVLGQVIQEFDADKQVVFEWRSWDHFAITDATHENYQSAYLDYVHANALELDADGSLLMSSRHMDEITKIDRTTGEIVWRWGGKHNEFTFVGDTLQFSHQHAIRRLANGHYLLFDNGNFHTPRFSSWCGSTARSPTPTAPPWATRSACPMATRSSAGEPASPRSPRSRPTASWSWGFRCPGPT